MKASLKAWHFAALATVAAFGLALYQLDHESFWFDEFKVWEYAHLPFAEIWSQTLQDFHPPLHAWLMYGWLKVAPAADEFWLRLPHAVFFALTVPAMYCLGRTLGGTPRAGVYAALLAATFPFLFRYAQWARPYAMLTFFAACGFAAVAHLAFRGGAPRLLGAELVNAGRLVARGEWRAAWSALGDDGPWVVYIVSASAVMWLHNTAAIFPMVTGLILLCAIWAVPSYRGIRFVNLCIATGLIALLYTPHALHIVVQAMHFNMDYSIPLNMNRFWYFFRDIYGSGYLSLVLPALFLLAMIAWTRRGQWKRLAFAVLGWLVAPVVLTLFSFWKPILFPKLLIWSLVPFLAVCAAGLALLPWPFVRVVLLAVLVAWNLQGVAEEWSAVRQDLKGAYQTFSKEASSGATVILCPSWYLGLSGYYLEKQGLREDIPFHVHNFRQSRQTVVSVTAGGGLGDRVGLTDLFAKYREIWLVSAAPCWKKVNSLKQAIGEKGRLTQQWEFRGMTTPVELLRYERRE